MTAHQKIIIAIDGFSACGKSTLAKALAKKLAYVYIDTGAMYRAVTYFAMQKKLIDVEGKIKVDHLTEQLNSLEISFVFDAYTQSMATYLNDSNIEQEIRTLAVAKNVSEVSKIKAVRDFLVKQQKKMGEKKGIVMDGRDIGTSVFPEAEVKFFLTAKPEIRAQRRFLEMQQKGEIVSLEDIQVNLSQRDYEDQNRLESPLRQAEDAIVIDNSNLTQIEQLNLAMQYIQKKI